MAVSSNGSDARWPSCCSASLAALATQLHRVQQRRVGAAQALAEEQARHAEDRDLMIGEMAHRMKNAFARIGALARITLRESDSLQDFETKFDGRMRALSDAKQMLVTGAVDSVDLGRIIRRELEIAGWSAERSGRSAGRPCCSTTKARRPSRSLSTSS
jgi:signal transduction histidine kinase